MHHRRARPWSFRWFLEHIASGILLLAVVLAATVALTALIITIEELVVLVIRRRLINTYTNIYGNAWTTILWHFLIIFIAVGFWSAIDTFIPAPTKDNEQ